MPDSIQAAAIVHIPKCAGTSLRRRLESLSGVTTGPKYHDPYLMAIRAGGISLDDPDPMTYSIEDLAEVGRNSRVVMGHISIQAFVDSGFDSIRIVVREPRARIISLFDHYERLGGPSREGLNRSEAFEVFLNDEFTRAQGNNFLYRMVAGATIGPNDFEQLTDLKRINTAVGVLDAELDRYCSAIVGAFWDKDVALLYSEVIAERFPENLIEATAELPRENVAPVREELEFLSEASLAYLSDLTALDELALDALIERGLLTERSNDDLNRDFADTAHRHGFVLG